MSAARVPLPGGPPRTSPTLLKGPPPGLRVPGGAGGGRGSFTSPTAARPAGWASRALRGRRYPPVAPDANEHMSVVPREPGVRGAGTWLSSARARRRRGILGTGTRERARARPRARSRAGIWELHGSLETRERARWLRSASGPEEAVSVT